VGAAVTDAMPRRRGAAHLRLPTALLLTALLLAVLAPVTPPARAAGPGGTPTSPATRKPPPPAANPRPTESTYPRPANGCAGPQGVYTGSTPWPQVMLDPPRIWPLSTGAGQLVAVVGTGVDPDNAQFDAGQVLPEINLLTGPGAPDCDGRGTFAAGIVAAHPASATTFAGVAPDARLLPIRCAQATASGDQPADPDLLASAIDAAVDAHATVILIVVPAAGDSTALKASVSHALAAGAVLVSPAVATQTEAGLSGDTISYPTALPGVIGVAAVDQHGAAVQQEHGSFVALAAPGANLVSTTAGSFGHVGERWNVNDPSFAAAYVAGVVALLRAYQPSLTPRQVATRLTLTASPPPGGGHDPYLGWGTLDAYAAVSAVLPANVPGPASQASAKGPTRIAPAVVRPPRPGPDELGGQLALLVVGLALLAVVVFAALRRGRARGFRPGRVTTPGSGWPDAS
jgi:membrane-anchored mycosin MYCP